MKLIQLYGGPGTGKSSIAAGLFYYLKNQNKNAELIQEYVKQWAWEGKKPISFDQFYLFGKQAKKEYTLINKVEVAVTDSPIILNAYYAKLHGSNNQAILFRSMTKEYMAMRKDAGVEDTHIFLKRIKPYNPQGRFQTEEEARKIDGEMLTFLDELEIKYDIADAEIDKVIKIIG